MRTLSLDTTTAIGSAALVEDDTVLEERCGDPSRGHAERLPGELVSLLEANHLTFRDIDVYAVASGPGSFTGLRIGIATMQGLALAGRRRLAAVSALEALAHAALGISRREESFIASWMDAYRGEVFTALYRIVGARACDPAALVEVEGPSVDRPELVLERWSTLVDLSRAMFIGEGALKYSDVIGSRVAGSPTRLGSPPLAGTIGRLVLARHSAHADPASVRPLYVRRPDAEIARDARKGASG
jgi:tRNA threonylcarbamoyladenosine biosynthesis protein TsaB